MAAAEQALRLSGGAPYVSLGSSGALGIAGKDFTLELWVKLLASAIDAEDFGILGTDDAAALALQLKARAKDGRITFACGAEETLATSSIVPGAWTHLAVRFTQATGELGLFVNGVLDVSLKPRAPFSGKGMLMLGRAGAARSLDALFTELRVWRGARSEAQIQAGLYRRVDGSEANLAGAWAFFDGTWKNTLAGGAAAVPSGGAAFASSDAPIHKLAAGASASNVVTAEVSGGAGWIAVPNGPSLEVSAALSVEAWVRPTGVGKDLYSYPVVSQHGASAGWEIRAGNRRCSFMVTCNKVHTEAAVSGLPADCWVHVAGVFDGQSIRTYVNGVLKATTRVTGAYNPYRGDLNLGRNSYWNDRQYEGRIAEARVFGRVLSQAEIMQSLFVRLTGGETSLLAWWRLESEHDSGVVDDASGRGNHGKRQGVLHWIGGDAPLPETGAAVVSAAAQADDPAKLRAEISRLSGLLDDTRKTLAQVNAQLGATELERARMQTERDAIQKKLDATKGFEGEIAARDKTIDDLQKQVKGLSTSETSLDDFVTNANSAITRARDALRQGGGPYTLGRVTLDVKMLPGPAGIGMSFPKMAELKDLDAEHLSSLSLDFDSEEAKPAALPTLVTAPSVLGYTETLARRKLGEAGLLVEVSYEAVRSGDGPIQADRVVRQHPRAGAQVQPGSVIAIFVGRES